MVQERKERKRKEKRESRKERKRREKEISKMQTAKEHITEAPITEDKEDLESLIIRRRKGKMAILDSESTEIAGYAGVQTDKPETIPVLSMLEKNIVADQLA